MPDTPDLAALIASRICHDLISPIGAIGNGVELLTMEPGGASRPELTLISESVANANARIRLFRIAFGAAKVGQDRQNLGPCDALVAGGRAGRVTHAWTSQGDLSRREVRLVFLLLLCLETVLPYGGRVEVSQAESRWTIRAEAQRTKIEPTLWAFLTSPDATGTVEAGQVQFALVGHDLVRLGRPLQAEIEPEGLRLSF
jgi:histidine phosphotransferase ChpT